MKTIHPSPVSPIDEREIAFLRGEPLPDEPPRRSPWWRELLLWTVGLAAVCAAWVAIVVLGLIFGGSDG